jgi:hypothetical protein
MIKSFAAWALQDQQTGEYYDGGGRGTADGVKLYTSLKSAELARKNTVRKKYVHGEGYVKVNEPFAVILVKLETVKVEE